jgi:hypothetical protein
MLKKCFSTVLKNLPQGKKRGLNSLIKRYDQEPEHKKSKAHASEGVFTKYVLCSKKLVAFLNPQQ